MNKFIYENIYIPKKFKRPEFKPDGEYEQPIRLELNNLIKEISEKQDDGICNVISNEIGVCIDSDALANLIKGEQKQFYELKKRIELLEKALDKSCLYLQKLAMFSDAKKDEWKERCIKETEVEQNE